MRKISRTRNECATRMMAPMLKGFLARQTAMERSFRRGASSRRISSVLRPNGGTFTSIDGAELLVQGVDRPFLQGEREGRAGRVLDHQAQAVERDGVEDAPDLVGAHVEDLLAADLQDLVPRL